jgi:hypothetical protein
MGFLHGFHWAVHWLAGLGGPLGGCALLALLGALAVVLFLPVRPAPRRTADTTRYQEYWNHS